MSEVRGTDLKVTIPTGQDRTDGGVRTEEGAISPGAGPQRSVPAAELETLPSRVALQHQVLARRHTGRRGGDDAGTGWS